ncbi:DNA-directed RNA polymerase [Ralstonia syzygii subsp. celebesensis]|uniref:DNA-directed RNA polymerase n=2 Tax=Ralstonia syzygii TaxID=28097 RepID=G2ZVZ6_9RALS|nr:DNA-directed RNA polymerase from phage [blood disease bacterium R229]
MMEKNEQSGRIENNPYSSAVFRRWLVPVRDMIEESVAATGKPGRRAAHVMLLRSLDPAAIAFIAVRSALTHTVSGGGDNARNLGNDIGKGVYGELVLATFEHINPELYWEVSHDLDKRRSKSSRHRYQTLRHSAQKAEIEVPYWSPSDRTQVGLWLVELMREVGLLEVQRVHETRYGKHKERLEVMLSEEAAQIVQRIRGVVEMTMPFHQPCIEPPKDWVSVNDGGYHTQEMRRQLPHCVNMRRQHLRTMRDQIAKADMTNVLDAINHLQRVRWQVNTDILDVVLALGKGRDSGEVVGQTWEDKPAVPEWLTPGMKADDMTEAQAEQFKQWKRAMAQWHTDNKARGIKWGRFYSATQTALKYRDYPAIHFVYQADFRGRLYAMTTGVSPQGSDMQKALLRFADGKPLEDTEAVRWFKINGANRYGIDKVTFEERIAWVDAHEAMILRIADDPVSRHDDWKEVDSPLQFLAWCIEYARWRRSPGTFVSRIPVGFDGSCNGLQHFSAMLRDSVGGRAVNLVPAGKPNDIYQQVADLVQRKLQAMDPETLAERDRPFLSKWLAHGMNRKLVKRSVMTLPYGSTRYSCAEFIVDDYLRKDEAKEFDKLEYSLAANFLSYVVWESIGEVVIAASQAMDWLQRSAHALIRGGNQQIEWVTPSGFPVVQVYQELEIIRARSLLLGGMTVKVATTGEHPSVKRHKNGMAPNFVHSMDAAHLVLTTIACRDAGVESLAMIHDDYGTHAADAGKLFKLIRETFVRMYEENNPILDFATGRDGLPPAPAPGELDLQEVLESQFFFA